MSRLLRSSVAALGALVCVLASGLSMPAAHAEPALRVLLTGDSITHGRSGDYTWRYRLYKEFRKQGVPVDFVGSRTSPYVQPGFTTSVYADPAFDHDHFALFGWELSSMARAIGKEVAAQQPDVVVLEAGINDFRNHTGDPAIVASTADALRSWIANVRQAKPDTRILLSPVLKVDTPRAAALNTLGTAYDKQLRTIAAQLSTSQSPITVAATDRGWDPTGVMSYDGLHPSPTGETFIAQRIAEALRGVGVLHAAPHIYAVTPWKQVQRPVVTVTGRTMRLTWSRQAVGSVKVALRRVGHRWVTPATRYAAGRAVLTMAPGAAYDVRIRLQRGRMIGPWGPIVRVRAASAATARPAAPARVTIGAREVRWTAAARATAYVVQTRGAHRKHWTTRRTKALHVAVAHAARARVRAVNAHGTSAWRSGVR